MADDLAESADGITRPEAEYALEAPGKNPVRCPQCKKHIATIHVVRLLRTKVNFVSTLPRRGHVIVCPECQAVLSAELGGL